MTLFYKGYSKKARVMHSYSADSEDDEIDLSVGDVVTVLQQVCTTFLITVLQQVCTTFYHVHHTVKWFSRLDVNILISYANVVHVF